jgi:hypothetical protein
VASYKDRRKSPCLAGKAALRVCFEFMCGFSLLCVSLRVKQQLKPLQSQASIFTVAHYALSGNLLFVSARFCSVALLRSLFPACFAVVVLLELLVCLLKAQRS